MCGQVGAVSEAHAPGTVVIRAWHLLLSGAAHRSEVRIWAEVIIQIFSHQYGPDTHQPEQKAG